MFMKSGVKKDGTLTAIDFKIYTNTGGYVGSAVNVIGARQDPVNLTLRLNEDGTFNYWSASHDMGNGSLTAQTMIMAEVLSINPRIIEPTRVDTETCSWNLGDYASRGVFVEGYGALKVAEQIKERILEVASQMYEIDQAKITIENSQIVADGKTLGNLGDIAVYAQRNKIGELIVTQPHESFAGRTSYGARFSHVEINKETGDIKLLDYVAVHDVGRVINRMGVEGQLEGGIQMGTGYALREKMTFDPATGQLQ
ncbi:hypothetical protein AZF37_00415 [endosymbiont 'TC1' of Trimyema compressum]|nr:hypothetical protein AZF37_00415 [endosymbiont 'TC1' of Trimyema compressum]